MIVQALAAGVRRARHERALAAWLAVPAVLALPLLAVPIYRAVAAGLPADRGPLEGLDGAAAVDLLDRALTIHGEALGVAAAVAAGSWAMGSFLLQAAAARALARGRGRVGSARLLGTLGAAIRPLSRLLAVAAALHAAAYGFVRILDGVVALAGRAAATDAGADRAVLARIAVAAVFLVVVRCWCRLALAVSARERSRSALAAFGRAASLAAARPGIAVVDLAAATLGLGAAILAALPRWLLPQGGWATVLLGLVLAFVPVLVRAVFRTAGIAATLEALAAAEASPAADRALPGRPSPAR